ncbi:BolA/IbaG family iron-sulfur metabolism protein [Candidatus Legionella polyplacis]|uniref:BolA/IbaG family iron-sulfur metabolism protein n=1 Tax=Candidatus Legionella polyplacis TaxID=2005262 RepID=A0ABZ2H0K4_9GAMM
MIVDELKNIFLNIKDIDFVDVTSHMSHCDLTIVSDLFVNKSELERQQFVYLKLKKYFLNNDIHSIKMNLFTKKEWNKKI